MNKKEFKRVKINDENRFNNISKKTNIVFNIILAIFSMMAIVPFLFVVVISFTDEKYLVKNGFKLFPKELSLAAYKHVINSSSQLMHSYGVTILITVVGTLLGIFLISSFSYVISRREFRYNKFFTMLIFIPMLFNGGMVSSYFVITQFLNLKNSIWALILPICMNSWYVIVLRTFFKTTVPNAIVESARIDGASELRTFFQIVLPISLPGIATIALFLTLGYWNDWFNALLYIDQQSLIPLQYLLIRIESSTEFLIHNAAKLGINSVAAAASIPKETAKMAMVVLSTAPIIFAYPFFQRYFVKGLTIGAVKE